MLMPGLQGAAPLAFCAEDYPDQRNSGLGFESYLHLAYAFPTLSFTWPARSLKMDFRAIFALGGEP